MSIPQPLRRFFWDCDPDHLDWEIYRDFITRRLLQRGDEQALRWLRQQWGDEGLKEWLIRQGGDHLSPRQLRYFGLILDIEEALVDEWVESARNSLWERRV